MTNPAGVHAVRRLLGEDPDFAHGVRFILANPLAYLAGQRYLEADLNRVFPGSENSDTPERRLAATLCELTAGLPTLSLHATHSHPDPIALVSFDAPVAELATELPVPYIVDETHVIDGAFTSCSSVITLEAGCQETDEAARAALRLTRSFLAAADALEGSVGQRASRYFCMDGCVEKPPDSSYELVVPNFERVEEGTVYATAGTQEFVASRPFVPILMSECGYEGIFGYTGIEVGTSLDAAREHTPADRVDLPE